MIVGIAAPVRMHSVAKCLIRLDFSQISVEKRLKCWGSFGYLGVPQRSGPGVPPKSIAAKAPLPVRTRACVRVCVCMRVLPLVSRDTVACVHSQCGARWLA